MQWVLAGVVLFLVFATKSGGASRTTTPLASDPNRRYLLPAGASRPASQVTPVAATGGGLAAILAAVYNYGSKAYSVLKNAYSGYQAITGTTDKVVGLADTGLADVATGIDEGVNAGLEAGSQISGEVGLEIGTEIGGEIIAPVTEAGAFAGEVGGVAGIEVGTEVGVEIGAEIGAEAGAEAAAAVAEVSASTALGVAGIAFLAVEVIKYLVNIGLNDYKTGQISKEIMRRKQIYIMQNGEANIEKAIAAAATFTDAMGVLAHAPGGTSGQVQFGIGNEYAGMHFEPGRAGTTETPNWGLIVRAMGDPVTLKQHPEAIANFIANLWVQTGPGGATAFSQRATFLFRLNLLSKLPYTPEWNYIRTLILNMRLVDPRDIYERNAAIDAVPIPPEDKYIRIAWARVDTTQTFWYYDIYTSPPSYKAASPEIVAYNLMDIPGDQPWTPNVQSPYFFDSNGQLIRIGQYDAPIYVGGNGA